MNNTDIQTTDLTALPVLDLMLLFTTLNAPSIDEMHGEFDATLLRQPSILSTVLGAIKGAQSITTMARKGIPASRCDIRPWVQLVFAVDRWRRHPALPDGHQDRALPL